MPPGFGFMSFATLSAFEVANAVAGEAFYDVHVLSESGGRIPNPFGMLIETERLGDKAFDTLLMGATTAIRPTSPGLVAKLQESFKNTRRIASICTGAFTLAEAGLLDGRRATTHWGAAKELQERFPKVTVEMDSIFIADGPIWTSAGMTAGIDLALSLIERDMGPEKARAAGRMLVVHHRRAGGQSQYSALLEIDAKSDRVQDALAFARRNLSAPLSVEDLAEAARLSPSPIQPRVSRGDRALAGQSDRNSSARSREIDARAGTTSR